MSDDDEEDHHGRKESKQNTNTLSFAREVDSYQQEEAAASRQFGDASTAHIVPRKKKRRTSWSHDDRPQQQGSSDTIVHDASRGVASTQAIPQSIADVTSIRQLLDTYSASLAGALNILPQQDNSCNRPLLLSPVGSSSVDLQSISSIVDPSLSSSGLSLNGLLQLQTIMQSAPLVQLFQQQGIQQQQLYQQLQEQTYLQPQFRRPTPQQQQGNTWATNAGAITTGGLQTVLTPSDQLHQRTASRRNQLLGAAGLSEAAISIHSQSGGLESAQQLSLPHAPSSLQHPLVTTTGASYSSGGMPTAGMNYDLLTPMMQGIINAASQLSQQQNRAVASSIAGISSQTSAQAYLHPFLVMPPIQVASSLPQLQNQSVAAVGRAPSNLGITCRPPVVLYIPTDDKSLSDYQCLARKQIELFEATQTYVESNAQGRNRPIVYGQVGIRCRHCVTIPPRQRAKGAVYYPAKLDGIYQAAQNMTTSHLCECCHHVPDSIRSELVVLRDRKSSAGGGKKYWADGVRALGVIEYTNGLRFQPL